MGSSVKGQPEAENRGTDNAMAKWKKIKKTKYDIKYTKQNKKIFEQHELHKTSCDSRCSER